MAERGTLERQWFERAMPVMQILGLPTELFRPSSLPARPPAPRRTDSQPGKLPFSADVDVELDDIDELLREIKKNTM